MSRLRIFLGAFVFTLPVGLLPFALTIRHTIRVALFSEEPYEIEKGLVRRVRAARRAHRIAGVRANRPGASQRYGVRRRRRGAAWRHGHRDLAVIDWHADDGDRGRRAVSISGAALRRVQAHVRPAGIQATHT